MAASTSLQLGMVGLGRMGANLVRRAHARRPRLRRLRRQPGRGPLARGRGHDGRGLARRARPPLDPAARGLGDGARAAITGAASTELGTLLEPGDTVIDGGNTYYRDDIRRAEALADRGIHYVDVGTSGGVFGLERGFCLMIGGEDEIVDAPRPALPLHRARAGATPSAPPAAPASRPPEELG